MAIAVQFDAKSMTLEQFLSADLRFADLETFRSPGVGRCPR
jgi:hypothetical protein